MSKESRQLAARKRDKSEESHAVRKEESMEGVRKAMAARKAESAETKEKKAKEKQWTARKLSE